MIVHLIDGTYELFRHFYGFRRSKLPDQPLGAVNGVLGTIVQMLQEGATHIGVATDHVIESFRNDLWPGYKTGDGIEAALWAQFHPLEEALAAMGVMTWPMVELEADDALASAAYQAARDTRVEKVCIWTPDKDLAQCVEGTRVVQVDRRSGEIRDDARVRTKFGVAPPFIPDYLALVGDAADGFPGIPGIGAKTAARLITQHGHIEQFPDTVLTENRERALLFKTAGDAAERCAALRRCRRAPVDRADARFRGCSRETGQSAARGESGPAFVVDLYSVLMKLRDCVIAAAVFMTPAIHAQTPAETNTAGAALHALFDREWEWELTQDPLWASYLGDRRWNDRWEDISTGALAARQAHRQAVLKDLAAIPREQLSAADRLNYDLFRHQYQMTVEGFQHRQHLIRTSTLSGVQGTEGVVDSLRFQTVKDFDDWLARLDAFPAYMDQNIALMREGIKANVLLPKIIAQRVRPQIVQLATQPPEESGYYRPFRSIPPAVPLADRERLAKSALERIRTRIQPAFAKLLEFMDRDYLPASYDGIGWWRTSSGLAGYRYFAKYHTTTDLAPQDIHALGLKEVARIRAEMEAHQDAGRILRHARRSSSRTCERTRSSSTKQARSCSTAIALSRSASIPSSSRSAGSFPAPRTA